jgi:hypothetical protein
LTLGVVAATEVRTELRGTGGGASEGTRNVGGAKLGKTSGLVGGARRDGGDAVRRGGAKGWTIEGGSTAVVFICTGDAVEVRVALARKRRRRNRELTKSKN